MFDKLKKLLEGGIAQINPFDGGKTFSTVVNNRPVQPARPQAQPQQQAAPQSRPIVVQKVRQPSILDHLASFSKNVAEPFNQSFVGGLGRETVNIGTKLADFAVPGLHNALKVANNGRPGDPAQNAADALNKTFFPEAGTKNSLSPTRIEDYNPIQQKARLGGSISKTIAETAALQGAGKAVQGGLEAAPIVQKALQAAPRATTLATNAVKAAAEAGGGRFVGGLGGNSMFTQNGPESVRTAGTEGLKWAAAGAVTSPALSLVPNVGKIPIVRSVPRAAVGAGIGAATAPIYGMDAQQGALFGALGGSARPINDEATTALARLNARLMGQGSTGVKLPPPPTQGPKRVTPTVIDKNTSGAMGRLNALDAATPQAPGTVRVYSGGPADMPLDWSFNNPDALASFHNGRVNKGDQFRFHDVNPADVMEVPGKPGQLRLRPGAEPITSQAVAIGTADAPYAYNAPGKVRSVAETNAMIQRGEIQPKMPNPGNVAAQDVPKSWLEPQPQSPFSSKKYIKEQVKAQEAAAGKDPGIFGRFRKEFATKGVDALSPIEKPINDAVGRDKALALRDQLDRSLRSDTIAGQFAKDNGIDEVIKGTKNVDALNQYLIARHAQTLEANGIKTGRDLTKDAQLLDQLGPEYKAHADAVTQYNQKLLDKTVEYGLISKETADMLKKKYPDYVPFERIFSPEELNPAKGNGAGPASLSTQSVIKRIEGSERQIQPPLESILSKTNDVIAQGERNLAAQEVAKTMDLPGNPLGLRELKAGETIGAKPTISFLENGVKRVFETTPEVAAAAKSLTRQQLGLVGKILSYPTRALRLGATGLNVGFAGANVVKDLASSFINSKNPLSSSVANPKVFLKALAAALHHNGKSYQEVVRAGAAGTSYDIGRNAAKATVGKIRSERNIATKALYTVRHPSELVRIAEDTIGRSEEFGRALQYYGGKSAAVRQGMTQEMATKYGADAARNNTVNFARAGEYARVLNSVLPYFNAGIQGSRTFMRNVKERPAQTVSKVVITAFMPVAAVTAWNVGDSKRREAYDDISDYEKQNNIIIVPPNPVKDDKGRWNVMKIPMSQEVANLGSIVRNGVEAMAGDANFDVGAAFGDLIGTTTSLNAGNPRQLVGQLTPQAIKPTIEALTNQNLFTGNTIVPDKMKNLDAKDQYGKYTSGTARVLGKATGISPFQIDNTIRTGFGGLGQNVVNVADKALAATGAIKPEDVKGRPFGESIVDRFAGAQGKSSTNIVNERVKKALDALKQTPGYQELSPEERAKALNRLENDAKAANYDALDFKNKTGQYAADYNGKKDKLSARQKGLLGDSTDISSYLKAQSGSDGKSNKDKYQEALDTYQDPNNGFTPVEKAKKTKELKRLKIASDYTEDVTMLHGMSKADAYQFLSTFDDGNKYAKQLLAYDDALTKAGLQAKNKFRDKYGNEAIKPAEKGSGGGKGKGKSAADKTAFVRSTYSKLGKLLTDSNSKITYSSPSGSKVAIRTKLKKAKTS